MSEALILASVNSQYDHRLFIEYIASRTRCSELVVFLYWTLHLSPPYPLFIRTWFLKSLVQEIDFWSWFFVYFKLDFYHACVACKNQVQNRQNTMFKNQVQKSSPDRYGARVSESPKHYLILEVVFKRVSLGLFNLRIDF